MEIPDEVELARRLAGHPAVVTVVVDRLGAQFEPSVLIAGGSVRDLLIGVTPVDFDLIVDGPAATVVDRLGGESRIHDRFSTATVMLDGARVDIARARRESYPQPGALPVVEPAGVQEDLRRRDFTVNAIAFGLTGRLRGGLIAAEHALADLARQRLRVLHPGSFRDDPTRLLRLARYRARLGFTVEAQTLAAADQARAGGALETVSGARIGHELRLIAGERDPVGGFVALAELKLDAAIAPGFGIGERAVVDRGLELLPDDGRPDLLVLAAAILGLDPGRAGTLLDRLAFAAAERDRILSAGGRAPLLAAALGRARRPSEIAEAVGGGEPELVALAGALGPAGPARQWLAALRHVEVGIDGHDIVSAGVSPGPAVGTGLRAARTALLDGRAPSREAQLAEALRVARASE